MFIEYESESFHDLWVVSFFCLSEYIQVQVQNIYFHFRSFQKLKFSCSSSLTSLGDPELIVRLFSIRNKVQHVIEVYLSLNIEPIKKQSVTITPIRSSCIIEFNCAPDIQRTLDPLAVKLIKNQEIVFTLNVCKL